MLRLSLLFSLDPFSVNPVLLLKYSWPTLGHILLIQCFPISVQTFLLPQTLLTTAHPLSLPIPLQPLQIQFHNLHLTRPLLPPSFSRAGLCHSSQSPPQPEPEMSSETSAPPSTRRVPRLYPTSLGPLPVPGPMGIFTAGARSFLCSTPPFMGSGWSRRHCLGSCPILPRRSISD